MLVLSRKKDERIVIGEGENQVIITILEIRGNGVRLGILANPSIPVHRDEVYREICQVKEKKHEAKNLSKMPKKNTS